jgi:nucleoside-diphosphate-sugar epimerase
VVHLAAVHRDDIQDSNEYQRTNVLGTRNIASICTEKNITKIIFTSTVAVYGFAPPGTDESGVIAPFNEYGRTKIEAEKVLEKWRDNDGNNLITIRPTVIFGEGNRGNVFNLLNQISLKRFVMVGSGKNRKSMAYVKNVVHFIYKCTNDVNQNGLYNYIDGPDMTMNELVLTTRQKLFDKNYIGLRLPYWLALIFGHFLDLVSQLSRRSLPISSIRVKKFVAWSQFASNKSSLDNFSPPYTIQQGIERTLDYEFISKQDPNREVFFTE